MAGNGQEYAAVIPQSTGLEVFARSFLQGKQQAYQREQQQQQQQNLQQQKKQLTTYEQAKKEQDERIKLIAAAQKQFGDFKFAEYGREMGSNLVNNSVADLVGLMNSGASPQELQMRVIQHTANLGKVSQKSMQLDEATARVMDLYKMPGVDPNRIKAMVASEVIGKGLLGTNETLDDKWVLNLVKNNEEMLHANDDGLNNFWSTKNIGTGKASVKKGSNLQNSSVSITAPNDAELDGDVVKPKSEVVVINQQATPNPYVLDEGNAVSRMREKYGLPGMDTMGTGATRMAPKSATEKGVDNYKRNENSATRQQNVLGQLFGDKAGKIELYDKEYFDSLMNDPAAAFTILAKAKPLIKQYEQQLGEEVAADSPMAEIIMRAVAYKERERKLSSDYKQASTVKVFTGNSGGGSGGSGKGGKNPPARTIWDDEVQPKLREAFAKGQFKTITGTKGFTAPVITALLQVARTNSGNSDLKPHNLMIVNEDGQPHLYEYDPRTKKKTGYSLGIVDGDMFSKKTVEEDYSTYEVQQ